MPNSIEIGSHVWVGCSTIILKGCNIGNNSVIGAGSVLSGKTTKENCIVGNNGLILKEIEGWRH